MSPLKFSSAGPSLFPWSTSANSQWLKIGLIYLHLFYLGHNYILLSFFVHVFLLREGTSLQIWPLHILPLKQYANALLKSHLEVSCSCQTCVWPHWTECPLDSLLWANPNGQLSITQHFLPPFCSGMGERIVRIKVKTCGLTWRQFSGESKSHMCKKSTWWVAGEVSCHWQKMGQAIFSPSFLQGRTQLFG